MILTWAIPVTERGTPCIVYTLVEEILNVIMLSGSLCTFCTHGMTKAQPPTTIRGWLWKTPETTMASLGPPVMKPIRHILFGTSLGSHFTDDNEMLSRGWLTAVTAASRRLQRPQLQKQNQQQPEATRRFTAFPNRRKGDCVFNCDLCVAATVKCFGQRISSKRDMALLGLEFPLCATRTNGLGGCCCSLSYSSMCGASWVVFLTLSAKNKSKYTKMVETDIGQQADKSLFA